jgi:hypothetical protein
MNEDSPLSPMTPPSTPFLSTAPSDPKTIPAIQLPTESPLITAMTAALDANMNDLKMPAAAYPRNTWIMADDDDLPPLVAETVPFFTESPAESSSDSLADSPSDSPAETSDSKDSKDAMDTSDTTNATDESEASDGTPDYTWSDVPSDSDEEDSLIPPRPWDGFPTALVVLFFAYMFTLSIGISAGRLLI